MSKLSAGGFEAFLKDIHKKMKIFEEEILAETKQWHTDHCPEPSQKCETHFIGMIALGLELLDKEEKEDDVKLTVVPKPKGQEGNVGFYL